MRSRDEEKRGRVNDQETWVKATSSACVSLLAVSLFVRWDEASIILVPRLGECDSMTIAMP